MSAPLSCYPPDQVTSLGFNVEISPSFERLSITPELWDEIVVRYEGNLYLSYDWCRAWWKQYGKGKELRLFLFRAEGEPVGIVPVYFDTLGLHRFQLKTARLLGANIPARILHPPVASEWYYAVCQEVLVRLLLKDQCDLLSFGPFSSRALFGDAMAAACTSEERLASRHFLVRRGVHTLFQVPASMERYFSSLSANGRKNRRKYELKLLKKEFAVDVEILSQPAAVTAHFGDFVDQHTHQWNAEGKLGHFRAYPGALEFHRELVRRHSELGRVRLGRLLADGEVIYQYYCYLFGDSCHCELSARDLDPKWRRFSLGSTGVVLTLALALNEGKKILDDGLGHYAYKVEMGATEKPAFVSRVIANRAGSSFRFYLFNFVGTLLKYGYHRVWYKRLSPRLPCSMRRPQWMTWLRYDL